MVNFMYQLNWAMECLGPNVWIFGETLLIFNDVSR